MKPNILILCLCLLLVSCSSSDSPSDLDDNSGGGGGNQGTSLTINHESLPDFAQITQAKAEAIQDSLRIYYGHTSHGRQLIEGMAMLQAEQAHLSAPSIHEVSGDLGHNGDASWADLTRSYLNDHPGMIEIVMWSWCGGVSDNTTAGIDTYLESMTTLEQNYPAVTFVYMTGHLDGSGASGNLRVLNARIRDYCVANNKVLFDFESIESYDPGGEYYADDSDACQWCVDWCAANDCPECASCAHSHCFNCYRKGQGFWCLLASILEQR